jgi:tRNA/rRNA methyltransferase
VRPKIAANIGAAARVMKNLGLTELVLVDPQADPNERSARQLSTHGESILDRCQIAEELGSAVADCVYVAGTSARTGGPYRRQSALALRQGIPELVTALETGPAALVFGPEPSGLADTEVTRCHSLLHIPADPTYPALNLAQAVAICLYELRLAWLDRKAVECSQVTAAPFADQERMYERLQTALEAIHFLYGPSAGPLMHAIRHLIGRARPDPMEVSLLTGLARQIQWHADRYGLKHYNG